MSYDRHPQYTFGPRHRLVTQAHKLPLWRIVMTILSGAGLGVLLALMVFGTTPAHAEGRVSLDDAQLRRAAESFNDRCRGGSGDANETRAACTLRDRVLSVLAKRGQCWNAKAVTPAQLWKTCEDSAETERRASVRATRDEFAVRCRRTGEMAYVARSMAAQGKRPAETAEVLRAMERQTVITLYESPEALTHAAYTRWDFMTPGDARALAEGKCLMPVRGMM